MPNRTYLDVHVRKLSRLRDQWFWSIDDDGRVTEYFTNTEGEGIFHQNRPGEAWKQDAGLCQFSLHGMSVSGARKKIQRYFQ